MAVLISCRRVSVDASSRLYSSVVSWTSACVHIRSCEWKRIVVVLMNHRIPNDDCPPALRVFSTCTVTTSTRSWPMYCRDSLVGRDIDGQSLTAAALKPRRDAFKIHVCVTATCVVPLRKFANERLAGKSVSWSESHKPEDFQSSKQRKQRVLLTDKEACNAPLEHVWNTVLVWLLGDLLVNRSDKRIYRLPAEIRGSCICIRVR